MSQAKPEHFMLSHFHWDHYSGLGEAIADPALENRATSFRTVYYPNFPSFMAQPPLVRDELVRVFLVLNAFVMGQETGLVELDLLHVIQYLNDKSFSYRALAKGDRVSFGEFTMEVLWPPRTVDDAHTIAAIRVAIQTFHQALDQSRALRDLYDQIDVSKSRIIESGPGSFERIPDRTSRREHPILSYPFAKSGKRELPGRGEWRDALPPIIHEALRTQRWAANHLSLSFRIGERILSFGDLEAPEIFAVATELVRTGANHFEHILTAHHGTHWHQACRGISADWAISSVGPRLMRHVKPQYKTLAKAHWVTHLMGGWDSALASRFAAVPSSGVRPDRRTNAERSFAEFFGARDDILQAVELEAENSPTALVKTVASLVLRLDVSHWTPFIAAARNHRMQDQNDDHTRCLRNLIAKLSRYESTSREAQAFVAACELPETAAEELQGLLQAYKDVSVKHTDIEAALLRVSESAFALLCREFRRMWRGHREYRGNDAVLYGDADEHYGYSGAWYVQLELARVITRAGHYRSLPFLLEALLGSGDELTNGNSWVVGIIKCFVSYSVSRQFLDELMTDVVGVTATEILQPLRRQRCGLCGHQLIDENDKGLWLR